MIKDESIFGIKLSARTQILILIVLTFIAYIPMLHNGFTYFSDDNYVLNNAIIQHLSWHNIKYIFCTYFDGHYHPFTMLSLGLTYLMGGTNPIQYQLTNLLLHLANTLLVFWMVRKLFHNPEMAFLVAILFGLHTIHVESVARISERKDMLYTFFFLLSAVSYIRYLDCKKWLFYFYSLLAILFSLFSKGQAVSFFFTVILIDYLRDRKLISLRVILEKLPFLFLALYFGYLNLLAQRYTGYFLDYKSMSTFEPILDAGYVLTHYIFKMILPVNLSALYPYPNRIGQAVPVYMWLYLLTFLIIIFLSFYFYKRNKMIFFGIMFYFLNILFMLRIIPVAENIRPDRYNYVPSIGFFIILYSIYLYYKERKAKTVNPVKIGFTVYLILLLVLTFNRTQAWKSGTTVWYDAYRKFPNSTYILQNVANLQISQGNYKEGFASVDRALKADPQNILVLISRLQANAALKNANASEKDLDYVRQLQPAFAETMANKANALFMYGNMRSDGVMIRENYEKAISAYPYNAKFYYNLGVFYYATKDYENAIHELDKGIDFKPYNIDYYYFYRALAEIKLQNTQMAFSNLNTALKYNPDNKDVKKALDGLVRESAVVCCILALNKSIIPPFISKIDKENENAFNWCGIDSVVDDVECPGICKEIFL